jgi:hypothetical protein
MSKQEDYKRYIDNHVANVKMVWDRLCGTITIDDCEFLEISELIKDHDKSKYSKEEFEGYRRNFYGEVGEKDQVLFDQAWNHHQKLNPHHWEFWVMYKPEGSVPLQMRKKYVIEMLCDWGAMSYKFVNLPSIWYHENRDKMLLHPFTRSIVEMNLTALDKVVKDLIFQSGRGHVLKNKEKKKVGEK